MPSYELTLVLPPELTEEKQNEILERVKKQVQEAKGKISNTDKWGKRELAYPIKKQSSGVYFFVELELPGENVGPVNRLLETNEEILRHLLVRG